MRAVQVSGHLDPAGRSGEELLEAWPTLLDAAAAAAEAGVEVTVLQAARRDEVIERRGVRVEFLGPGAAAAARGVAARRRALLRSPLAGRRGARLAARAVALRPDVVHLHGLGFPRLARTLARRVDAPLLVQDHAARLPARWRRPLLRWGLAPAAAVGFTAPEQAEPFVQAGVLAPGVRVVPMLESSSRFAPGDRAAARAASGLDGDPCVLWIGRLDGNKDPLTALEAVGRAAAELPGLRLWCCYGDAPLLGAVRRRIAGDPRLAGRVRLLGRVPHARVETLCRAADLYLTASRFEGSGYAALEALACGLPAVATDIPSLRRIVGAGGEAGGVRSGGWLAPPGDPDALARALLEGAAACRREPEATRRRVRRHFESELSFEAVGREVRAAYEAAMAAPTGAASRPEALPLRGRRR